MHIESCATAIHHLHCFPPGLQPEEALLCESLLHVLAISDSGDNLLCFQASGSDYNAGSSAPLCDTTSFRAQSLFTQLRDLSGFTLRVKGLAIGRKATMKNSHCFSEALPRTSEVLLSPRCLRAPFFVFAMAMEWPRIDSRRNDSLGISGDGARGASFRSRYACRRKRLSEQGHVCYQLHESPSDRERKVRCPLGEHKHQHPGFLQKEPGLEVYKGFSFIGPQTLPQLLPTGLSTFYVPDMRS